MTHLKHYLKIKYIASLSLKVLEDLEEEIQKNREDGKHSVIIFDDVGSQLRKSQAIDKKLTDDSE